MPDHRLPTVEPLPGLDGTVRLSAMRWLLLLDAGVRLTLWCFSVVAATAVMYATGLAPPLQSGLTTLIAWSWFLGGWVVLFNVAYILALVALRALIPTPGEGVFPLKIERALSPQILCSVLIGVITKSRLEAPAPGFLVFHLTSLPPLCWLVERVLGPRSASCQFAEPYILDPHLVEIGSGVVLGFHSVISGHVQVNDKVFYRKVVIEDGAVVGGNAMILAGARIGRGAMIGVGAIVLPDTRVGQGEFWAGIPAKKICDLSRPEAADLQAAACGAVSGSASE